MTVVGPRANKRVAMCLASETRVHTRGPLRVDLPQLDGLTGPNEWIRENDVERKSNEHRFERSPQFRFT
jgi:hypothetical protein